MEPSPDTARVCDAELAGAFRRAINMSDPRSPTKNVDKAQLREVQRWKLASSCWRNFGRTARNALLCAMFI